MPNFSQQSETAPTQQALRISTHRPSILPFLTLLSHRRVTPPLTLFSHPQSLNRRDPAVFDMYELDVPTLKLTLHTINPGETSSWLMDYNFDIRVSLPWLVMVVAVQRAQTVNVECENCGTELEVACRGVPPSASEK